MSIQDQYRSIHEELAEVCRACGRRPEEVRLIAVSKTVEAARVQEAIDAGALDFGENRPEQIMEKHERYPFARWHFIGNVQSRRIKDIVPCASLIHSVFKSEHLAKIDAAAQSVGKVQDILIEVNVSGEESKGGVEPDELFDMLKQAAAFDHLAVRGLMTMAPQGDLAVAKACFAQLRSLLEQANAKRELWGGAELSELSMGMSEDWRCAVAEGATMVRVGRAIFSDTFE